MTALEELGRVETADVLVIGGGIAGLAAAVAAKEKNADADVLVVEKATSGWAGQANKGAGVWWYLAPEDDAERFVRFHCDHIGHYIEDQDLLADFGRESLATLERMDGWTGKFQRRDDGQFIHKRFKPFLPWSLTGADLDLMRALKRTARKLGVRFIDKTSLTDLLTDGGRIAGAVGFSLLDGSPIVVKAPAAIIATGGQSYRIMGMWSCQRGDGLGMAWRAGAHMRNAEWGPFAQLAGIRGKEPLIGSEDALYNAWHEKLSPRFRGEFEADVCGMTSAVWYQQMMAGNGPLVTFHPENWMLANTTEDVEGGTVWDRPEAVKFWTTLISRVRAADAPGAFLEVFPAVLGELSPIAVDHQMATTVPGLYACGNACYNGSGLPGAVVAGVAAGVEARHRGRHAVVDGDRRELAEHRREHLEKGPRRVGAAHPADKCLPELDGYRAVPHGAALHVLRGVGEHPVLGVEGDQRAVAGHHLLVPDRAGHGADVGLELAAEPRRELLVPGVVQRVLGADERLLAALAG